MLTSHQTVKKASHQSSSAAIKDYPSMPTEDDLKLSENGLSLEKRELAWKNIYDYFHTYRSTFIGYQSVNRFDFTGRLQDYLGFHLNNVGDPFDNPCSNSMNTKVVERAVLNYFSKLWKMPESMQGHDEGYWGYVVSMGCTEANLCALYNAREYLSGKPLVSSGNDAHSVITTNGEQHDQTSNRNALVPVAFYSEDAYHGLNKAMRILKIDTFRDIASGQFPCPLTYPDDYPSSYRKDSIDQNGWPYLVPADSEGAMHLPALVKLVNEFVSRGYPPMVIFTSGTTFKGSFDNPEAAINELVPILKQHNMYERRVHYSSQDSSKFDTRHGFWFHVDGALGACQLPFLEMAIKQGLVDDQLFPSGFPVFDFRIPEVCSIATSIHKWIGCPFPAGILMMRRKNQVEPDTNPLYVGGGDTTVSGSRNGHGALVVWDFLSSQSCDDLARRAATGEKLAAFTVMKLQEVEMALGEDLWVSRSPGSLLVHFKQPREDILRRYSLASKLIHVKSKQGLLESRLYSHICVMSHVREELIESIVEELKKPGAFPQHQ